MNDFDFKGGSDPSGENKSKLSFSGKPAAEPDDMDLSSGRSLLDEIEQDADESAAQPAKKEYDFDRFTPRGGAESVRRDIPADDDVKEQSAPAQPVQREEISSNLQPSGAEKQNDVDEFVIGSGFEINKSEHRPVKNQPMSARNGKSQKSRWVSVIIWVAVILTLAVGLASGMMLGFSDMFGIGKNQICQVTITEGMSTSQVAKVLEDSGAIEYPLLFKIYSKLKKYDGTYRYGVYEFNSNKGYDGIVEQLQIGNEIQTVKVQIPERATIDDITKLLEENGVCTRSQFLSAMRDGEYQYDFIKYIPEEKVRYRLEGYLYPDTYSFFVGESTENAHRAIDKMLNNLNSKLPGNYQKLCEDRGYTFHEVMTMASIVELEANGYPNDMKKVAAVFYNRLNWDEAKYLGSTPTYSYPDNRYNTNAPDQDDSTEDGYEGLPPGPLCSMTIDAVKGSLEPENPFSATYFVTDSDMNFYYTNSYNEHLQTIARLKSSGKWTY